MKNCHSDQAMIHMVIQIDSREKARAITKIVETFNQNNIKHPVSKLMVGDYMN